MEISDSIFSEILADGPSPGTLLLVLSKMKEDSRLEEVIKGCLKALSFYPNDIYIRRLLAETYFEKGLLPEAESEMEKVLARIDGLISSYSLQAEILIQQKKEYEAAGLLKLYLAHRPDDQEALKLFNELKITEEVPISAHTPVLEEAAAEPSPEERDLQPEIEPSPDELETVQDHDIVMVNKEDKIKSKKMKMIAILESWLEDIRELPIENQNSS